MFPVAELESRIRLRLILLKTRIRALARYKIKVKATSMLEGDVAKIGNEYVSSFFAARLTAPKL